MNSPAFQLYVNDLLGSAKVGMMSTEEVGAYLLLLCLDWQEGGFEYDQKRLAKWCRLSPAKFRRAWEQVGKCFTERDGRMWNPRLEKERAKQEAWRVKAAKGAAATNEKKRYSGRYSERSSDDLPTATAVATAVATDGENGRILFPFPSPSPTPVTASSSVSPDVARVLGGLADETVRLTWAAEIDACRAGMAGHVRLTDEQIDRACRDYVGNGHLSSTPILRHFRAFLATAAKPAVVRAITTRPSKQEAGRAALQEWLDDTPTPTPTGAA